MVVPAGFLGLAAAILVLPGLLLITWLLPGCNLSISEYDLAVSEATLHPIYFASALLLPASFAIGAVSMALSVHARECMCFSLLLSFFILLLLVCTVAVVAPIASVPGLLKGLAVKSFVVPIALRSAAIY